MSEFFLYCTWKINEYFLAGMGRVSSRRERGGFSNPPPTQDFWELSPHFPPPPPQISEFNAN